MNGRGLILWLAGVSAASLIAASVPVLAQDAEITVNLPEPPAATVTFDAPAALPEALPEITLVLPAPPEAPANFADIPVTTPPAAAPPPVQAVAQPTAAAPADVASVTLGWEALQAATLAFASSDLPAARTPAQVQALRREREALTAFYTARAFQPLFVVAGAYTPNAKAALARLARASEDGLDVSAYPLPAPLSDNEASQAQAELRLAEAVAAYGRQASGGRVDPGKLSSLIAARPVVAETAQILSAVATASDADAALQAFNPPQKAYAALRAKLIEIRAEKKTDGKIAIPPGPALREGMSDPRSPLLRARFGLEPASGGADALVYDAALAAAIIDFQRANGLPATGVLTPRTTAALAGGEPVRLENEIIANMERWRWMPRDMGESRVEVNIPDYKVTVFKDGAAVHAARVVVGKPDTPTPIFSNTMQFIIVNPSWYVPQSIIRNEMLPRLARDPLYLTRQGYEVVHRGNSVYVRQPPGERNALGRIKFMFPNDHAVYLHDTPSRALFGAERRAFSHGCVRVDQPFKLAEIVLGRANGWSEERVKGLIGGGERTIHLTEPLPIHIMYFTASVDEAGKVQLRDDIYGYSRRVKAALGLEGEAFVEAPARPRPQRSGRAPAPAQKIAAPVEAPAPVTRTSFFAPGGAGPGQNSGR